MTKQVVPKVWAGHMLGPDGRYYSNADRAEGQGGHGFQAESGFTITGTLLDGQVVTLRRSGGGFGEKYGGGKPLRWIPLDTSMDPDATYSRVTTSLNVQSGCAIQTDVKPANANGAARQILDSLGSNQALYSNAPIWTFDTGRCYVYVKRYHAHPDNNGGSGSLNCKTIRVWRSGPNYPNAYYSIGTGLHLCYVEGTPGDDPTDGGYWYDTGFVFSAFDNSAFATCEHVFIEGQTDAKDGVWNHARNGRWLYPATQKWVTRTSAGRITWGYLDQISNGTPAGSIYYHSLYIDDSLCRVFVSTEQNYSTAAGASGTRYQREICIPIEWSDSEIKFLLRQGAHDTLAGKCLYVGLNDGSVLKAGQFV